MTSAPNLPECQCAERPTVRALCPVFRRSMTEREYQLCSGAGCTAEQSRQFRQSIHVFVATDATQAAANRAGVPGYMPPRGRAWRFIRALWRWAKSGFARVGPWTYRKRRALCNACEFRDATKDTCRKCGCGLDRKLFSKLRARTEKCPVGKW